MTVEGETVFPAADSSRTPQQNPIQHGLDYVGVAIRSMTETPDSNVYKPFLKLIELFKIDERDAKLILSSIRFMDHSRDPLHKATHPSAMAQELLNFIAVDPEIKSKVDGSILVLGIAMHDLWWSLQRPTIKGVVFGYMYEGKYAPIIAKKMMLRNGYDETKDADKMSKVLTIIAEHTLASPKSSPESQWLYGLDCLALLHPLRMADTEEYFTILSESKLLRPLLWFLRNSIVSGADTFEYEVKMMEAIAKERGPNAKKMFREVLKKFNINLKIE